MYTVHMNQSEFLIYTYLKVYIPRNTKPIVPKAVSRLAVASPCLTVAKRNPMTCRTRYWGNTGRKPQNTADNPIASQQIGKQDIPMPIPGFVSNGFDQIEHNACDWS